MKYIVASPYSFPDSAGIAVYTTDLADWLSEKGNEVSVVTAFPFYPEWRKKKEDERRLFRKDIRRSYCIYRSYIYVPQKVSTIKRIFHEFSFCISCSWSFIRIGKVDRIIVFTPPFFLGFTAYLFRLLWGARLSISIQDLPVDAALALGMMKPGKLQRLFSFAESCIYRRADQVVTISQGMLENVKAKRLNEDRIKLVYNWIDTKNKKEVPKGEFRKRHGFSRSDKLVVYSGNLGKKQGVELLLEIAKNVESKEIKFVVIGDGAEKENLLRKSKELNLENAVFLPFLSQEDFYLMLQDADFMFVSQRSGAGNNFLPSKVLRFMSWGKPLFVVSDAGSELSESVRESEAGVLCDYESIDFMVNELIRVIGNKCLLDEFSRKGIIAAKKFDRETILSDWEESLVDL